MKGEWLVEF